MIGRTLGHYAVLERLGAGGMGVVYRARDQRLGREVALKILPASETADPGSRARLMREARLASSLNHPHICVVHEVDEQDGEMFIAMELIRGQSLKDRIPRGGLPVTEVLRLGAQIADALAHAHAHGVIHRDLKALNVMVTPEGSAKVVDFGLARPAAADGSATIAMASRLTESGVIVGTVHYMSPEVLRGEAADERSDLWALGVLLYEMASGVPPFHGDTPFEMAASILHGEPTPLPERVPAGLRTVIMRCLEKDRARRYQEASEVRSSLEALAAGLEPAVAVTPTRKRRVSGSLGLGASVAIGVVTVLLLFARYRGCPGATVIRSLAVLPLENLSGDPSQEYFADGMTDELINLLTQVSGLRVISRTSIIPYRKGSKSLAKIGNELGVQAVVEGSVRKFADRVKVTIELTRVAGEENLWGASYDRELRDVISLQSEVARAIVDGIEIKLSAQERSSLTKTRPLDPEAYDEYLRGRRDLLGAQYTRSNLQSALVHFENAVRIDPRYAAAYASMGSVYYSMSNYYVAPDSAMPLVVQAARHALEADGSLAEAHTLLGMYYSFYRWDQVAAEKEFRRALQLNPGSFDAHFYHGYSLVDAGRLEDARAELRAAREIDPLSSLVLWVSAWPSFFERRYDETIAEMKRQTTLDSTQWTPWSLMGETLELEGKYPEALQALRRARSLGGNPWVIAALARVNARLGARDSTARLLSDLKTLAKVQYVTPYGLATVYWASGDHDQAFHLLERALAEHCEDLTPIRIDPRVDSLRADPRYRALLDRMESARNVPG